MTDVVVPNKIRQVPVGRLKGYERNSRTHSEAQIGAIVESIRRFGFTNPILVAEDMTILAGHGRLEAARSLGLEKVPCVVLAHLSDAERRAYVIADNKLAELAGWDQDLLRLELGELRDLEFDLGVIGFSDDELALLFLEDDNVEAVGNTDDDAVPPTEPGWVSRLGDVWICGDHRVACGSSTDEAAVERLIAGRSVDCVWTDPPYNVAYEAEGHTAIVNDDLSDGEFAELLRGAFGLAFESMRPGAPLYVAHADTEGLAFRREFARAGFKLSGCLIWVKPSLVLGRSDYQWRHEPILYGWKPGAAHSWYGGRKKTTVREAEDFPCVVTDEAVVVDAGETMLRISGPDLEIEELAGTVVRMPSPKRNADHPTMKPVSLILSHLKNSSLRGDAVYDPFGGSGSTLIACQKIGRQARLMELEPKYCDVIVRRWQDFTGEAAVLERNGLPFAEVAAGSR